MAEASRPSAGKAYGQRLTLHGLARRMVGVAALAWVFIGVVYLRISWIDTEAATRQDLQTVLQLSGRALESQLQPRAATPADPTLHSAPVAPQVLATIWPDAAYPQPLLFVLLHDDGRMQSHAPRPSSSDAEPPLPALSALSAAEGSALRLAIMGQQQPEQGALVHYAQESNEGYLYVYQRLADYPVTLAAGLPMAQLRALWWRNVRLSTLLSTVLMASWTVVFLLGVLRQRRRQRQQELDAQALRNSEADQRLVFDTLIAGLVVHDGSGQLLRCNARAELLLGLSAAQMQGRALIDPGWRFVRADGSTMPVAEYPVSCALQTGAPVENLVVGVVLPGSDSTRWLLCNASLAHAEDGSVKQVVVNFVDISAQRESERLRQASESRLSGIFDSAMDAIISVDASHQVVLFNHAAEQMFGYPAQAMLGQGLERLIPPHARAAHGNHLERFAQTGVAKRSMGAPAQLHAVRSDGTEFPIEASISQIEAGGQRLYTVILRDITARLQAQEALEQATRDMARANEKLAHIAHFDALTGLPNRVLMADRLQQAMAHCQRTQQSLAVAFLDLDGFKQVNDSYGHDQGDVLLVAVAQRMHQALREGDTLARIGGDEFVAVLVGLEQAKDCEPVLNRLLAAASSSVALGAVSVQVSCSIGVTIYPQDGVDADKLLRHADQAMYGAKQSGKGRFHLFDVAQDEAIQARRESLDEIRQALARSEFVLHYQPKVNMHSGAIVGAEALIRWQHPQRGLLPPGAFLPRIENDALSIGVGQWVLGEALRQMTLWKRQGLQLPVSVNIGAQQLQGEGFVALVAAMLAQHAEVPASWLTLEILETSALEDMARVSAVMQQLRHMGVGFALDDFGTGYSSLTYLKHLPAELLKIDQSFVRDMLVDKDDFAIVQGVIGLAHAFGRQVIAEGVETLDHGSALIRLGSQLGQGYGIARPMPATAVPGWMAAWRPDPRWTALVQETAGAPSRGAREAAAA